MINKSEATYDPPNRCPQWRRPGTTSANGTVVGGLYGTLRIGADGSFFYDVDSTNTTSRPHGRQTLTEFFTYRITDTTGLTDTAQLVITVHGVNDPPVARKGDRRRHEQGGVDRGTPGGDPSGDATVNDIDPEATRWP